MAAYIQGAFSDQSDFFVPSLLRECTSHRKSSNLDLTPMGWANAMRLTTLAALPIAWIFAIIPMGPADLPPRPTPTPTRPQQTAVPIYPGGAGGAHFRRIIVSSLPISLGTRPQPAEPPSAPRTQTVGQRATAKETPA